MRVSILKKSPINSLIGDSQKSIEDVILSAMLFESSVTRTEIGKTYRQLFADEG
jgi:hypothetical protein